MPIVSDPRWGWAAEAVGSVLAGVLVLRVGTRVATEPIALAVPCFVMAAVAVAGALMNDAGRARLAIVLATLRLTAALLALAVWQGEGRVLWAALAVWFAVGDARHEAVANRPLAPAGIALAVALVYNAWRPGPPAARMILVALVAAVASARFTRRG